jgi:hypothetical protein
MPDLLHNFHFSGMSAEFMFVLPNVKDERDGYLARSVRQHDP